MDLGRINKYMWLRFNMIIKDETQLKQTVKNYNNPNAISTHISGAVEYLRLHPGGYVCIDINHAGDRNDAWNSGLVVNLGMKGIFLLQKKLKTILKGFTVKDLFFKQSGKLYVNQAVASSMNEYMTTSTKTLKFAYAVVPDEENKEIEYEGIAFMINQVENFCYLTYEEIEFLLYVLSKVNIMELSLQVINTYLLQQLQPQEVKIISKPVAEKVIQQPEVETFPAAKNPNEIPEI